MKLIASVGSNPSVSAGSLNIKNPIKPNDINELITAILKIVVQIGTPILVLAIIYVGFKFVAARGNPGKLEEAKQAFVWTLIGAAIVLGAFVISTIIQTTIQQIGII
jgi:heme/copper-type cytochrome/quinol oxidase subunit 2